MQYLISLTGNELTATEEKILSRLEIAGVILYGRNILSLMTTRKLINSIKSIRSDLLIAVDEEGGLVSRFTHLIPNYSQPFCATLTQTEVRDYYARRAEFLKNMGIDMNLAPVVDLVSDETAYMYKRSYGDEVNLVTDLAELCIQEQKRVGLLSCIKHFPGHGRVKADSHHELPVVELDWYTWLQAEGKVFGALIEAGVEAVMVGHLVFPQINPEIATVSSFWVNEVLRQKFEFKGNVVTDDICMKSLLESVDTTQHQIFEAAGVDMMIITEQEHPLIQELIV